jgi:hypothetical protein
MKKSQRKVGHKSHAQSTEYLMPKIDSPEGREFESQHKVVDKHNQSYVNTNPTISKIYNNQKDLIWLKNV